MEECMVSASLGVWCCASQIVDQVLTEYQKAYRAGI